MTAHFSTDPPAWKETRRDKLRRWVTAPVFLSLIAVAVAVVWVRDAVAGESE